MRTSRLKSSAAVDPSVLLGKQHSLKSSRGLLPFHWIEGITLCGDLVLIMSTSVLTGIAYHLVFLGYVGPMEMFLGVGALVGVNSCAVLAARRDYRPQSLADFWKQLRETTIVWLFVFFILAAVAFAFKVTEVYSRGATLTFFLVGLFAINAWRLVVARFIGYALAEGAFAEQKVILLAEEGQLTGTGVVDELRRYGYRPVRTFEFARNSVSSAGNSPWILRSLQEIIAASRQMQIECVFLLVSWNDRRAIEQLMELLGVLSVPVYLLPDQNVAHFLSGRIVNVGIAWMAELKRAPLTAAEQALKRAVDLLLASAMLVTFAPMMIVVGVLVKIESSGPILFLQTRNGFNGRPFRMCKFRTMSVLEDGPVIRQASKNDQRFTGFGRLLRRTNVDELPQLLNVIAGDMSLVGPRPHAAAHNSEYERIIANYAYRYNVKPGLTGWAQVNGFRGETKTVDLMAKRVDLDLWYINNWSPWLDFKILLRTLIVGIQPNAY